jgi:hypothetical protein
MTTCPTGPPTIFFVDTFIENEAQNPQQVRLGSAQLCPGADQQERVKYFGPGVTPPGGSPPPEGRRAFRREIQIGNASEAVPFPLIILTTIFDLPPL